MSSPNTENYFIGKGSLYFDRFDSNGNKTGEIHLGNAPDFTLTPELEKLEHFSSTKGLKTKDKEIVISAKVSAKFNLEEYTLENLKNALLATEESFTQTAGNVTDQSVVVSRLEAYYDLGKRSISNVVVTDQTGTTTYVEGDDYTVDEVSGRIFIPETSAIAKGDTILVDYDYADLSTGTFLNIAKETKIEGVLRFKGDPAVGKAYEFYFGKVSLSATGDIALIGDDWGKIEFTAEALKDADGNFGKIFEI